MYDDLELEDQSSDDGKGQPVTTKKGVVVKNFRSRNASGRPDTNYFGDEDDVKSEMASNLGFDTIRMSDTRLPDESSVSNPYGSTAGSVTGGTSVYSIVSGKTQGSTQYQPKKKAFHNASKRQRVEGHAAPAFLPIAPNKAEPIRTGFTYQKVAPDAMPKATWNTIDPETKNTTTTGRTNANVQHSDDPFHPSNDPLALVLGTSKVQKAANDRTALTHENIHELNRDQVYTAPTEPQIDVAWSNNGSCRPSVPSSRPSVKTIASSRRPSQDDTISLGGGESVASGSTVWQPSKDIHDNIRENFVPASEVLTHQAPKSNFEKINDDWAAAPMHAGNSVAVFENRFGNGNVSKIEIQAEMRIADWDESGNYRGEFQGAVKKRVRRGFFEIMRAYENEMIQASEWYRQWLMMTIEERMAALAEIRKPISQWASGPGAKESDIYDDEAIPRFYKKKWDAQAARRSRLDRLIEEEASAKSRKTASSQASQSQRASTKSVQGALGDLDGALKAVLARHNVSGNAFTSRNSTAYLATMVGRAVNHNRTNRSGVSRGTGSVRSVSSQSTITQSGGVNVGQFVRSTGHSVAGPRSVASYEDFPALGSQPSGGQGRNSRGRAQGTNNTSRAPRSTTNQSNATFDTNFQALLEYDDSPLLQEPVDVAFPYQRDLDSTQVLHRNLIISQSSQRGRAVYVRLHGQVEFSGVAIAKRVFGGIVQEFQLHPEQKAAVVVFVHATEARAFVAHIRNVHEIGKEQDIRELQIEASWYKDHERESIIPHQPNLLSFYVAAGATRALKIHNIHHSKLYTEVAQDLAQRLNKLFLFMRLESPIGSYKLAAEGRTAVIEFASLSDAIDAWGSLSSGLEVGYEKCNPVFVRERSSIQAPRKDYCTCLGCVDRKRNEEQKLAKKIAELRGRNYVPPGPRSKPSSVVESSSAHGSTQGSTKESASGVWAEDSDDEDLIELDKD